MALPPGKDLLAFVTGSGDNVCFLGISRQQLLCPPPYPACPSRWPSGSSRAGSPRTTNAGTSIKRSISEPPSDTEALP